MTDHRPGLMMAVLVFAAAVFFAISPFLVQGFNGFEPDQFPVPQDNPPVQPAGYAFAIWGLIYLWLLAGAGFGLIARGRAVDWQPMRQPLALSMAVGAAWLPVAQASPFAATLLIWIMLISALVGLSRAPVLDHWLGRAPVALYAGWLTAASCVSIGLMLAGYGVMDETTAAVVSLLLALILGLSVLTSLPDIAEYGYAVAWALIAVVVNTIFSNLTVAILAGLSAALVAAMALRSATRGPRG